MRFLCKNSIMRIAVVTNDVLKTELLTQGLKGNVQVEWFADISAVEPADCCIDLLFSNTPARIETLKKLQPAIIVVNAVIDTLDSLPENFVRINGWHSFLKRPIVEAACNNTSIRTNAETVFTCFHKTADWVPDMAGFISARIISMVINEAYFTLSEKVSSKEEIDIAMKLGTNYPYGPFEWSEKIGLHNIYELLTTIAKTSPRYEPASLLQKEALLQ